MNHILALILIVGSLALAQEPKPPDQPPASDAAAAGPKQPAPPKIKTMEEGLKGKKEIPGLITLCQDTATGKLSMVLKNEQLGKEFVYFVNQ